MTEQGYVNLALSLYRRLQIPRANPKRFACDLHLSAEQGLVFCHDFQKSDHTVGTGHSDFDRVAVFCVEKQRDDSTFDKPRVINRDADIKKDSACFEADSLKMGPQSFIDNPAGARSTARLGL